jgi:hypothetical protein
LITTNMLSIEMSWIFMCSIRIKILIDIRRQWHGIWPASSRLVHDPSSRYTELTPHGIPGRKTAGYRPILFRFRQSLKMIGSPICSWCGSRVTTKHQQIGAESFQYLASTLILFDFDSHIIICAFCQFRVSRQNLSINISLEGCSIQRQV